MLNPDGNAWQNSGYSWACNMEPNADNSVYNESYLKARIGYLCDDDFGGMTLVNLIRLEKEEGEAFVNREPQEYFRRTCLSVSYDKAWVTWPDDATRNGKTDVNGIVIPDSRYPAVVYAYSVPNAEHPGCYDVYYYVSDDSKPLVTGTCAKLFKTGFDSEQTCGGQKIFYTSNYEDLSGIAYWDFENVTNMDQMFANCTKIIDIDLNGVFSNSSGISTMFKNCTSLESVSITGITNKFTSFANMFKGLPKLSDVTITGDFSGVTTAENMFYGCMSLEHVTLNGEFKKLTNAKYMFGSCVKLPTVTILGDFSNVTTTERMFDRCNALTNVSFPNNLIKDKTTIYMFNQCYVLKNIPENLTFSSQLTNASYMFNQCMDLSCVSMSGTLANVTTTAFMFNNCQDIESITIPGNLTSSTTATYMFNNCQKLNSLSDLTFGSSLTSLDHTFSSCKVLENLTLNGDYSGVTTVAEMFNSATNLSSVVIGDPSTGANFTSLVNAFNMFYKWPESKYDVFKDIISQINLDIDKFPGGKSNPYRVTSSGISGRWRGGVDGDTVVTANGLVYRMDNGYMTYWHLLPIDLWKFNVSQDNDNLLFAWKTACETNNECFILEYSLDGLSYSTIAQLAGAGNSSRINSYSTVWESVPYTGMLYFRLKQRDFSGHITYSNVIAHNMVCNPCKDDSLPKIYYGTSQYRVFNKKLIFCKGDNNKE